MIILFTLVRLKKLNNQAEQAMTSLQGMAELLMYMNIVWLYLS